MLSPWIQRAWCEPIFLTMGFPPIEFRLAWELGVRLGCDLGEWVWPPATGACVRGMIGFGVYGWINNKNRTNGLCGGLCGPWWADHWARFMGSGRNSHFH